MNGPGRYPWSISTTATGSLIWLWLNQNLNNMLTIAMHISDLQQQIEKHLYMQRDLRVLHWTPVAGSSINTCFQLTLQDNRLLFAKLLPVAPADFYVAEQHNLEMLAATGVVNAPAVLECTEQALIMAWIPHGAPSDSAQYRLGQQLAMLHNLPAPTFGFEGDNFCGRTGQSNTKNQNGWQFFAEQRLLAQGIQARQAGYLTLREMSQLETIASGLKTWIPEQAPALLHGDLWAGNFLVDTQDQPWLIDPASYWGWPEADLAMTRMFGGFSEAFYRGYDEVRGIDSEFEERIDLYNLYHWLNHLNMFGSQYHSAVSTILKRFAGH